MKVGAQMLVITPYFTHACAYGDPTHKSFLSEWVANYLHKAWRDTQAPHVGYTCDFDFVTGGSFDPWIMTRSPEVQMFAMQRYVNSMRDLHLTLTKRAPT